MVSIISRRVCVALAALALGSMSQELVAQRVTVATFVPLGGESEQRARLQQLLGRDSGSVAGTTSLFRSASTLSARTRAPRRFALSLIAPEVRVVSNSALPYSLNDGSLWAGRGANTITRMGVGVDAGRVRLWIAPQLTTSENKRFQVIPYPQSDVPRRSEWANPFHPPASSIDLPFRFGDQPLQRVDAGQSSLTVELPYISTGVATENISWGPGRWNQLVLSDNAAGFPHAFAQTRDGVKTRVGRFDAQWILGQLRESDFFDFDSTNNVRSLSGIVVVWTPAFDSAFSIGMARTVLAPTNLRVISLRSAVDVFRKVGQPDTDPEFATRGPRPDQLISFFARWRVPQAGVEAYGEWARFEEPRSIRDLLEFPGHSQGYTLGVQWARPIARLGTFTLQAEGTNVEPDASIRVRPVATSYTSRAVAQGYTNRGKSLGASIGPGSSSQSVSADLFGATFRVGAFASRIRWDNATLWEPIVPQVKNEDVSVLGGLRGSVTLRATRLLLEYTRTVRLGYLYQDKIVDPLIGTHSGVDILNRTVSVTLSTYIGR